MPDVERPCLLLVDDRPGSFTDYVMERPDIDVILLRFEPWSNALPQSYVARTERFPTFVVRAGETLESAADHYREWVASREVQPRFFCNPHEPLQEVSQRFAGLVGLPHLDTEQVTMVRRKPQMKERFQELGIPCAEYREVATVEEIRAFADTHGWPLIVKPVDSFASIDTYKIDGPEQLEELPALDQREWMVEKFLTGKEYQLCAVVARGVVLDAWPSWTPAALLETVSGSMNANVTIVDPSTLPVDVKELTQKLVDGMRIDHGYLHMEFFLSEDGSYHMSEIGARIAGCEIPTNHGLSHGFDVFAVTLDTYLGRFPELEYTQKRCVGDLLLPVRAGTITRMTGLDELKRMPGVVGGQLKFKTGDRVDPRRASNASSGYLHLEGESVEETAARMQYILDRFEFEVSAAS
ncbi:ATP-dependent carboxylate-amine ligase [Streptomyces sp. NPDC048710]|uniref:ATP-grasp domain-containing protein n=1 Tax=Streptomyces sp. NPDC048710 TaxID=3365586 RepID=UPI003712CF13